jgi:hypothetical protein
MSTRYPKTPLWFKLTVSALLVAAIGWWAADRQDRVGNERRLSVIASQISGRDVHVRCPGPLRRVFGWEIREGSVRISPEGQPVDWTRISKQSCAELDALAEGRRDKVLECTGRTAIACGRHGREAVMAVDVLSHESWHLNGIIDEDETECRSLQTVAWTAQQFGATEAQGRAMARAQYDGVYREMPEQYQSGACQDGGAMDLHADDPRFP